MGGKVINLQPHRRRGGFQTRSVLVHRLGLELTIPSTAISEMKQDGSQTRTYGPCQFYPRRSRHDFFQKAPMAYRRAGTTSLQKRSMDFATFSRGINPPTLVSATMPESPNSSEIIFN